MTRCHSKRGIYRLLTGVGGESLFELPEPLYILREIISRNYVRMTFRRQYTRIIFGFTVYRNNYLQIYAHKPPPLRIRLSPEQFIVLYGQLK